MDQTVSLKTIFIMFNGLWHTPQNERPRCHWQNQRPRYDWLEQWTGLDMIDWSNERWTCKIPLTKTTA